MFIMPGTYWENPSRFDSTPKWGSAGGTTFTTGLTVNDGATKPNNHEIQIINRTDTGISFPVITFMPGPNAPATSVVAMDLMPKGAPGATTSGLAWFDVCDANVQNVAGGNVGTARVAAFAGRSVFGSANYGSRTIPDIWIIAGADNTTPHLFLKGSGTGAGAFVTYGTTVGTNIAFTVTPGFNTWTPLAAAGVAGQSVDLFATYLTLNGTRAWSISNTGVPTWGNANGQTTIGAAGGASALPATPSRYLKVIGDNGTAYVVPAYLPV